MKLRLMMAAVAAIALTLVVGCSDDDEQITSQRDDIVRFLTTSHDPRLIAEADVANSLEVNPEFYEELNLDLYRYIADYYNQERQSRAMVDKGDEVSLTFTAYTFTGGVPRTENIYYTNDPTQLTQLKQAGLNAEYWSEEPLVVNLGDSNIIKGVAESLVGCRQGDSVEVYMTFEQAYKDKVVGVVPHKSAVAWYFTIDSVIKH